MNPATGIRPIVQWKRAAGLCRVARVSRRRWLLLLPVLSLLVIPAAGVVRDGGIDPANLGKGDWVYSMTDATNRLGGHVSSVTNETSLMLFYKSQDIRYFIVKAATSDKLFNGCYSGPQFTSALVNIAHANGILIFGYNRSYGSNIVGEISISDYVFNQGADGFVWDAEAEWENTQPWIGANGPALAWQLCSAVRSNWPTKFLAHAPFPIISYHSSFPYKEFGYWCDTVMPQIYHSGWTGVKGTASGGINWSDVNWANWQRSLTGSNSLVNGTRIYWTNAIRPLAPVENVYGPVGSSPCEGTAAALNDKDVMEFLDYLSADPHCVTVGGYNGANFWRTDLHGTVQWANIKAGASGAFPGVVNNLVIDDSRAATVGTWTPVRTFYNGAFYGNGSGTDTNSFGTNYLTRVRGTGGAYAQFRPNVVVPGDYSVYQWHPYRPDASTNVPFVIAFNGGSTTVYANQQTNAGNWSLLGRFNFAAGTAGYVRVTDGFPEPGAVALADGMKWVFVPPTSLPAAPGGLSATAVSPSQINLSWADNATNETGFVVSRSLAAAGPFAAVGSVAGGVTNFADLSLSSGTTYYYLVKATNFLGASANSASASATTLSPPAPPDITAPPNNQSAVAGQTVTFAVTATGASPLSYQWWLNSQVLAAATNSTYARTNVQPPDAGDYRVVITNAVGAVTSAPAALAVNFSLTVSATAGGSVSTSPLQSAYQPDSTVTLTATPDAGFGFLGWSGDTNSGINPLSFLLTTNMAITGNFASLPAPPSILSATASAAAFTLTFSTEASRIYTVEYTDTLDRPQWRALTNVSGSGAPLVATDTPLTNELRFYRVRVR